MFCMTSKRWLIVLLVLLLLVLGLAYVFQWQIILAYAPFLLVLACPLMHLFGGHGNHASKCKHEKHK
jgi:hypothetical protein